ncbi:MAG: DUF2157 domain-containing protein [Defluviitaleaceae bacterium]|nr:DUF2157 domain-containing protein [Defluviitaleaceae bacterium]MCL2837242.1 DUF2157 domain-containing protein [Defluviitaleaceae bacterium]
MKKERWLLKEIDMWRQTQLIDEKTAGTLRGLYADKKNISFMLVLFSIIGTLLISTGVILIGARNWEYFPMYVRVIIAFTPLAVSQSLAVFTVKKRYHSLAWRESAAILATASVFMAIAVVGQIFHLPGDYGVYVFTCGLLALPMIYILNAASPLTVYYWTILNWAALEQSPANALILFGLFILGALFVYIERNKATARLAYISWITVIAGFVMVLIMGTMLRNSLLLTALCFFVLLLSVEDLPEQMLMPLKFAGITGGLAVTAILTYEDMWSYRSYPVNAGGGVMTGIMLAIALFFAVRIFKRGKLKFLLVMSLILLCALRFLWAALDLSRSPYDFILMCVSNLAMLSIGVGFIAYGVKNAVLLQTNIGMAAVCALIVMRFFDSSMDILWRGIVFLLLGTAFLLVNKRILRKKKQPKQGETI